MQYLLLIYSDGAAGNERFESMSEEERTQHLGRWWQYDQELRDAGVHVAGEALQPTMTAKTVRGQDGELVVTDGPFAETKEQLLGYYLIEAESLDGALAWAGRMPNVHWGSVEVRPVADGPASAVTADRVA